MANELPTFQFEDVPLEEARQLGRGSRMDSRLYQELRTRVQSLSDRAVRLTITEDMRPTTMKNWVRSVAAELGILLTMRRVPGGLIFWRSTDEDVQQAKEIGARLQTAQRR
jgi:hypothetical protein